MTPFQSFILITFGILAYIMLIDENVVIYLTLVFKIIGVNIERFYWMIKYHPNNFITTWIQNRKYDKIAKNLYEELVKEQKEV